MRRQLLPPQAALLEGLVGLMLVGLGLSSLRQALQAGRGGPVREHSHHGQPHRHATLGAHVHVGGLTLLRRPLLVGFAHGLAGSGTLTAAALSALPTVAKQPAYLLMFGAGSAVGMALLSGMLGLPLSQAARRPRLHRRLSLCAGSASVLIGVYWTAMACGLWPQPL